MLFFFPLLVPRWELIIAWSNLSHTLQNQYLLFLFCFGSLVFYLLRKGWSSWHYDTLSHHTHREYTFKRNVAMFITQLRLNCSKRNFVWNLWEVVIKATPPFIWWVFATNVATPKWNTLWWMVIIIQLRFCRLLTLWKKLWTTSWQRNVLDGFRLLYMAKALILYEKGSKKKIF